VAAAFLAAARRLLVFAARRPAARRFRVTAALRPVALDFLFLAAFLAAARRFLVLAAFSPAVAMVGLAFWGWRIRLQVGSVQEDGASRYRGPLTAYHPEFMGTA